MSRITQIFYGNDCLPYKDKERTVHYPISGCSFAGSSNVNELRFYVRDIGGINNLSWVAIVKLPNGKIIYQLLTDIHLDSEINEYYVSFNLSSFYTQLKGDIYISLNGCLGQVEIETDEETNISTIEGEIDSRTVVATGAVKFTINYAPQRPIGFSFELDQYQTIINALADKSNIISTFQIVADISQETLSAYNEGQVFYDIATKRFYKKTNDAIADYNFITNNQANVSIIVNPLTNVNGRVFVHYTTTETTIGGFNVLQVKYDGAITTETQAREYMAYMTGSSFLPTYNYDRPANTYFLTPNGELYKPQYDSTNGLVLYILPQLALKSYVDDNYVPYNGANTNVDLGQHYLKADHIEIYSAYYQIGVVGSDLVIGTGSGDIWLQPEGYAKYITQNTFGGVEHEIANVDFVLDHYLLLTSSSGTLNASQYLYACRDNAIIKYDGVYYRKESESETQIIYRSQTIHTSTSDSGYQVLTGDKNLVITKSSKTYAIGVASVNFYNKAQTDSKFATDIELSMNSSTYVLTLKLKDANGSVLATQSIDLPLESIITSATYYDSYTYDGTTYSNVLVIVLATTSVPTIIPVGSLIQGLEHEAYIEVSDLNTDLTAEQLALAAYPNARIKYGNNFYLKSVETSTTIVFALPYLDVSTVSGHIELVKKEISVTKSSGAMVLNESTTSFYNKSQADTLLNAKANSSDVYDKQAADNKFRTESQVDDQIDTKLSGLSRINYIEDLEEDKNYDYKFIVKEDGELVMRITEVE